MVDIAYFLVKCALKFSVIKYNSIYLRILYTEYTQAYSCIMNFIHGGRVPEEQNTNNIF